MEENSYMNTSRLRPPSRIASPGKGLFEISESQGNARSVPPSKMLPPGTLKREICASGDERDYKQRKTLKDRAGEPISATNIPNGLRSVVKGFALGSATSRESVGDLWRHGSSSTHGSIAPMGNSRCWQPTSEEEHESNADILQKFGSTNLNVGGSSRYDSFSSSTSSRAPSTTSRTTSNSSFASSVGPSTRPKSSYGRPQTSMAFSQSTTSRTTTMSKSRPATSMDNHPVEGGTSGQGKRNGMRVPSLPSSIQSPGDSALRPRKVRSVQSMHSNGSKRLTHNKREREVSVSTAFASLQIHEEESDGEHQAISNPKQRPSTRQLSHKSSITSGMRNMKLHNDEKATSFFKATGDGCAAPKTPSHIPVRKNDIISATPVATPSKPPKTSPQKTPYLTKDSNTPAFTAWDHETRLETMEAMYSDLKKSVDCTSKERTAMEDAMTVYKTRIAELESIRIQLSSSNQTLQTNLDDARQKLGQMNETLLMANAAIDEQLRSSRKEVEDARRDYRNELDQLRRENDDELKRIIRQHREELREMERGSVTEQEERIRELERRNDAKLEDERSRRLREVEDLRRQIALEQQNLSVALEKKELEIQTLRGQLEEVKGERDREQTLKSNAHKDLADLRETLQKTGATTSSTIQSLEATVASLRARIHYLESDGKAQSDSYAEMESRMQEAVQAAEVSKQKLIKEETLRRILFNQVQELKGNIRVMCRVRPVFDNGSEGEPAKLKFPDTDKEGKELEILGKEEKSSLGNITRKAHSFAFDRVFGPESQNQEVFEEISQLVQSALDGYNVCIFCYGQTGSGKTHTMSSVDGMIPRATQQIYETATNLKDKGWVYTMEGSFVEVYNEDIHDLLSTSKDADKKKHEIRHDEQKKQTTVTGLRTVTLDSPNTVDSILKQAAANRSVAATKSNERSSRSHSVFILRLVGRNSTTGETSEGTLNLVDLAGSERLKQSGAEGDRMKETQNINRSLSCLGDVIGALGQGKEGAHIPYRNSKLTYLLQYSLGGNSKTLMFTMISPMEANLTETLTSLKFATKVHNTHIGTAKKNTKMRD